MAPDPDQLTLFGRYASALLLGLLVGLQREYASRREGDERRDLFAGTRTYALYALLGAGAAHVSRLQDSPLVLAVVILMVGVIVATAYVFSARGGRFGMTSEVAALITLVAGALCLWGQLALAAALAVATTVLLALKLQTRSLASRLTDDDLRATLTFAVLTLVILPVLPRHGFGPPPFDVLVPYKAWLMVVLISGISFLGYVMIKLVGPSRGVGLAGLLGGLASSTAVTLSFAQRSHGADALARPFAFAILLAWTTMFARVLLVLFAIHPALAREVAGPLLAATGVSLCYCAWLYRAAREQPGADTEEFKNPFELLPALTFGALYMVILVVANAARLEFGAGGLYVSAVLSGLVDVDAITLSMAELSRDQGSAVTASAGRAVVLAAATNTLVKAGIVLVSGSAALRAVIVPGLVLLLAAASAFVILF